MKPECKISPNGDKYWLLNGSSHREDGPAIVLYNGDKQWLLYGKRHREDGPAIEWSGGHKEWYYQGNRIDCKDNQEFLRIVKLMIFL